MFVPDADWLRRFHRSLRSWYRTHARNLPWRNSSDPYVVWISEIMLQQTTVAAVTPYFERFVHRFPTVLALADADQSEVLRHWEGLGYYSRARNLHKAARIIAHDRKGDFPDDVAGWQALPGIGRYTAGAIVSFAYDRPAPIVEANTLRLYSRLTAYADDPHGTAGQRALWNFAEQLVPKKSPGAFNQALMDLGATLCTVSDPNCSRCPVRTCCQALRTDQVDAIPRPRTRPTITDVAEASVAISKAGAFLLRQRTDAERWAGLWDFPRFELPDEVIPPQNDRTTRRLTGNWTGYLEDRIVEQTGIRTQVDTLATKFTHGVTRYRIHLYCCLGRHLGGRRSPDQNIRWVPPEEFDQLPLSVTGRKFANFLRRQPEKTLFD